MKILFVSHKHPWPLNDGTRQRLFNVLKALAREHSVTLLSLISPTDDPAAEPSPVTGLCERTVRVRSDLESRPPTGFSSPVGRRLKRMLKVALSPSPDLLRRWDSPEMFAALKELHRHGDFDLVWVARSYIAEMVRRAGFERVIVDVDDIESISRSRQLSQMAWSFRKCVGRLDLAKLRRFERSLPKRFSKLVVCKEEDREFFGRGSGRVHVVPNGVSDCPPSDPGKETFGRVLFLGTMGYEPNIDAVRYFASSIFPDVLRRVPQARFDIVGRSPAPEVLSLNDGERCIVHGTVDDVTPHYESASLIVTPIRLGSGTRLKVLEALARGKALVATSTAIEGLDLRPGVDLEVVDDPGGFAQRCASLLGCAEARRALGESGRQRVLERYRWESIGNTILSVVRSTQ